MKSSGYPAFGLLPVFAISLMVLLAGYADWPKRLTDTEYLVLQLLSPGPHCGRQTAANACL